MPLRTLAFTAAMLAAAPTIPAFAKDTAQPPAAEAVARSAVRATAPPAAAPPETIAIAVFDGRELLWSGSLRLGSPYGNANYSQSKSEHGEPCPGAPLPAGNYPSTSQNLSLGISRHNGQQEPDRFNISLNWSKPVDSCQGEGNDSFGFNRMVTVPRGESVTVAGSNAISVRLTRPR
jgi:hypothetical protein